MTADNLLPYEECPEGICHTAGDPRFKQTMPLAMMHSLMYRTHNKIADNFAIINPHWDDNRIFYESRRLLIAIFQSIMYNEWLPLVLGLMIGNTSE